MAASPVVSIATTLFEAPASVSSVEELPALLDIIPPIAASSVEEIVALTNEIPRYGATSVEELIAERLPLLIRNEQITINDVAADRLINLPVQVLSSRTGLNLLTTQTLEIYQVPLATTSIVLGLFIEITAVNTVTAPPHIRLGIAAGEDDIFTPEALNGVDTLGESWSRWLLFSSSRAATASQFIKLGVEAGSATALEASVYLLGFNIPD